MTESQFHRYTTWVSLSNVYTDNLVMSGIIFNALILYGISEIEIVVKAEDILRDKSEQMKFNLELKGYSPAGLPTAG